MRKFLPIVLLAVGAPAFAQSFEGWFSGGQGLLSNSGLGTDQPFGGTPNDVQLTDGFRFAFRVGFNSETIFGHEVQYAYQRTQLKFNDQGGAEQGMAVHSGGYNFLVYATKEGSRIRPFGTGGLGFFNFVPPGSSAVSGGGSTKFGFNYGGGVKVKITNLFAIRGDVRQYISPKPFSLPLASGWLRMTEISAGFGVEF
ncbi:MAG TPA: outer membrane beta-barrel protein [Bryobacteraceae bacterium]|nr:outer membrane beta-barrel protein [Bryobacteraceae bacterium]